MVKYGDISCFQVRLALLKTRLVVVLVSFRISQPMGKHRGCVMRS